MDMVFAPSRRRISLRALLLPREHGGWSLALEPVALGLIAAPSWAGTLLAVGALTLFLMRQPAQQLSTGDRRAWGAVVLLGSLGGSAFYFGLHRATGPAGLALLAAVPAGAAFAWFDRHKAARATAAELAGAACFAAFPLAIALAGDRDLTTAFTLGGFALGRSVTTILAVRTFLRRRRREPVTPVAATSTALIVVAVFGMLAVNTGRWMPAAWALVFAARTAWLLGPWAPDWPARRLGLAEMTLGTVAVIFTGISLH